MAVPLVQLKELQTHFFTGEGVVKAVDGVSFEIREGETLGVVGESGCGKSVTALSIMRLILDPPGKIVGGDILFRNESLLQKSIPEMRKIRGNEISMIFQEPMTSLNPVYRVGDQIAEAIELHQKKKKKEALELAVEMLRKVEIPIPEKRVYEYPHQLSGGIRQRVMIAMALSCNPKVLIADEPTTALDVTIQAQILELINDLKEDFGTSIMLITHDLGVIAEVCERVVVMYAGKVVEYSPIQALFKSPNHPYTLGLLNSIPKIIGGRKRLITIEGVVPSPDKLPSGCSFNPRCTYADDRCREEEPYLETISSDHQVRCWNFEKVIEARKNLHNV